MNLAGFPDDPPHKLHGSQAYHSASVQAAAGTMVALYARELTGTGQHVDVSLQESVLMAQETAMQYYDLRKEIVRRSATEEPQLPGMGLYPCKDGHIWSYVVPGTGAGWDVIVDWMDSEGMAGDLKGPEYEETFRLVGDLRALMAVAADPEALTDFLTRSAHLSEMLAAFIRPHTKKEIHEAAASRLVMMVPAQNPKDLVESRQLEALGYFADVEHPELGTRLKYPGAPYYHISDAPWRVSRRAPLVGEHNAEIYEGELGFSGEQTAALKQEGII